MDATGAIPQPNQIGPVLHVVLYEPEIPQNTGNIGRTCVALGAKLWIVRPTGFRLDAANLKRAGLDYWQHLDWQVVDHWSALAELLPLPSAWLVTKFGQTRYTDARFQHGDVLVIGRETNGLPDSLRQAHPAERQLCVPMPGPVRSLNQATCTGIVMYEAYRQICDSPYAHHSTQNNAHGACQATHRIIRDG